MKQFHLLLLSMMIALLSGCSAAPLNGTLVSNEKNIWIEDLGGNGLSYCEANSDGSKADPVCYSARKATPNERASVGSGFSAAPTQPTPPTTTPAK